MTDLIGRGRDADRGAAAAGGKRERLIDGARQVLHAQGVEGTTLADIATAADVPVGNVYYYFKTKDDLVQAVIAAHADEVRTGLASLDHHRTPKTRLKAFVRMLTDQRELAARYGCPHGSLCSELDKRHDELSRSCAQLIRLPIEWAERQFRAMGRRDARELAVALIASYQGVSLLANTFRDPELMAREGRRLSAGCAGEHRSVVACPELARPELGHKRVRGAEPVMSAIHLTVYRSTFYGF
jgi:TetR/AcrR family transcriptional regulator, transcriptional repressor for nem operon